MGVSVKIVAEEGRTLKQEVEREIDHFQKWFQEFLKNIEPLSPGERAILNDYLGWKAKTQG